MFSFFKEQRGVQATLTHCCPLEARVPGTIAVQQGAEDQLGHFVLWKGDERSPIAKEASSRSAIFAFTFPRGKFSWAEASDSRGVVLFVDHDRALE